MKQSILFSFLCVVFSTILIFSCGKKESTTEEVLQGKWNLILWDNEVDTFGTFVFKDSLTYFNMNLSTEVSKFKINKDTIRFRRIGGGATFLASQNYWLIEKLDTAFFKLIGSDGILTTAYKQKYFYESNNAKEKKDTTVITF